jgi:ankyrin repeat protein
MLNEGFDMSKTLFRVPEMRFRSTALKFVVKNNNLSLVQFLLEKGVNPNIGEWTPLIISIIMGFHQISEKLITLGTNTCKPDKNGQNTFILGSEQEKYKHNKSPLGSRG